MARSAARPATRRRTWTPHSRPSRASHQHPFRPEERPADAAPAYTTSTLLTGPPRSGTRPAQGRAPEILPQAARPLRHPDPWVHPQLRLTGSPAPTRADASRLRAEAPPSRQAALLLRRRAAPAPTDARRALGPTATLRRGPHEVALPGAPCPHSARKSTALMPACRSDGAEPRRRLRETGPPTARRGLARGRQGWSQAHPRAPPHPGSGAPIACRHGVGPHRAPRPPTQRSPPPCIAKPVATHSVTSPR